MREVLLTAIMGESADGEGNIIQLIINDLKVKILESLLDLQLRIILCYLILLNLVQYLGQRSGVGRFCE